MPDALSVPIAMMRTLRRAVSFATGQILMYRSTRRPVADHASAAPLLDDAYLAHAATLWRPPIPTSVERSRYQPATSRRDVVKCSRPASQALSKRVRDLSMRWPCSAVGRRRCRAGRAIAPPCVSGRRSRVDA
jgi:hypothetical protein